MSREKIKHVHKFYVSLNMRMFVENFHSSHKTKKTFSSFMLFAPSFALLCSRDDIYVSVCGSLLFTIHVV